MRGARVPFRDGGQVSDQTLHLALDLGASGGRAMVGGLHDGELRLEEVHRFAYAPRLLDGHLRWDMPRLLEGLRDSLRLGAEAAAACGLPMLSVGVDAWGVDYGLLDSGGALLEEPICYRDARTQGVMTALFARVPRDEIFARTGIQFLPFNTLYQLAAHVRDGLPANAARLLLMPDLCHQALCGAQVTERTNASTTQLLGLESGAWDDTLFACLDLPRALMPAIVEAGAALGTIRPDLRAATGVDASLRVIAPATHDTGSAVAGTPLAPGWAFISSGTWSLVGVERAAPLTGPEVARANFTNEAGAGGTTRFLTNVMGLWILECCRRECARGDTASMDDLLARVAARDDFAGFIYPDDPRFFHPASMIAELRAALRETGQDAPDDIVTLAKIVLDSLALRYASVLATIERLTGCAPPGIHVIGGGARNRYLNQATADAAARPLLAGPIEAAATGNVLVQAMACGEIASLGEARAQLRHAGPLLGRAVLPRRTRAWAEAIARYGAIEAQAQERIAARAAGGAEP